MNEAKKKSQEASTWRGFRWALQHAAGSLRRPDWRRFWSEAGFAIAPERRKEWTKRSKKMQTQETYKEQSFLLLAPHTSLFLRNCAQASGRSVLATPFQGSSAGNCCWLTIFPNPLGREAFIEIPHERVSVRAPCSCLWYFFSAAMGLADAKLKANPSFILVCILWGGSWTGPRDPNFADNSGCLAAVMMGDYKAMLEDV